MGRKRSTNTNLPDRMRARKRTRKTAKPPSTTSTTDETRTDGAKKSRWVQIMFPL